MKKPTINLDEYNDEKDLKYDNRGMYINPDGSVRGVIYMWLSDERREQNANYAKWYGNNINDRYCPFDDGDKVTKLMTSRNIKMTGKITYVERDYYSGDCLVLYVKFDKCSSKRWVAFKESLKAA